MDTTKVYEEKVYKKAQNQARQDVVCFFSPFASGIQTDVYAFTGLWTRFTFTTFIYHLDALYKKCLDSRTSRNAVTASRPRG